MNHTKATYSYFWVSHGTLQSFFLRFRVVLSEERLLDLYLSLSDLLRVLVIGILLGSLLEDLQRFGVVTHSVKDIGFADIGLD